MEENIEGNFEMMEDIMKEEMVGEERRKMIEKDYGGGDKEIEEEFEDVLKEEGEKGMKQIMEEEVGRSKGLKIYMDEMGVGKKSVEDMNRDLGFEKDEREEDIMEDIWKVKEF